MIVASTTRRRNRRRVSTTGLSSPPDDGGRELVARGPCSARSTTYASTAVPTTGCSGGRCSLLVRSLNDSAASDDGPTCSVTVSKRPRCSRSRARARGERVIRDPALARRVGARCGSRALVVWAAGAAGRGAVGRSPRAWRSSTRAALTTPFGPARRRCSSRPPRAGTRVWYLAIANDGYGRRRRRAALLPALPAARARGRHGRRLAARRRRARLVRLLRWPRSSLLHRLTELELGAPRRARRRCWSLALLPEARVLLGRLQRVAVPRAVDRRVATRRAPAAGRGPGALGGARRARRAAPGSCSCVPLARHVARAGRRAAARATRDAALARARAGWAWPRSAACSRSAAATRSRRIHAQDTLVPPLRPLGALAGVGRVGRGAPARRGAAPHVPRRAAATRWPSPTPRCCSASSSRRADGGRRRCGGCRSRTARTCSPRSRCRCRTRSTPQPLMSLPRFIARAVPAVHVARRVARRDGRRGSRRAAVARARRRARARRVSSARSSRPGTGSA